MKKWIFIAVLLFILCTPAYADCIKPETGMKILKDAVFCPGTYSIGQLEIASDNITIDCNNATLRGSLTGYCFYAHSRRSITIRNCIIENYEASVFLERSMADLEQNTFRNSKTAVLLVSSADSTYRFNTFDGNAENVVLVNSTIQKTPEPISPEETAPVVGETQPSMGEVLIKALRIKAPSMPADELELSVSALVSRINAQDALSVERSFAIGENITIVTLVIKPKKAIANATIYESIPKCFAKYLKDIEFMHKGFDVIEDDPLIVWQFRDLGKDAVISYTVDKEIDEKCKKLFIAFGIYELKNKPNNAGLIAAVIISALIALAIIFIYSKSKRA